ncbi:hypothetical protein [Nodosilinea sp. P-1105]|uniref:hypothetical protein n=1 Tax=Nodosilinea sp. P-1105 TaxID=2546229 RepID=UPI00146AAF6E|nr:hypothetical protein [Nodosilinea sp. P-1105]
MFWLSMVQTSAALQPIAAHSRPWSHLKQFWRFCCFYGEYQAQPPSRRRRFMLNHPLNR